MSGADDGQLVDLGQQRRLALAIFLMFTQLGTTSYAGVLGSVGTLALLEPPLQLPEELYKGVREVDWGEHLAAGRERHDEPDEPQPEPDKSHHLRGGTSLRPAERWRRRASRRH